MPATRTSSIPPRTRSFATTPPKHRLAPRDSAALAVSDEEDNTPRILKPTRIQNKPKASSRTKKPPLATPEEVIEISSDDDCAPVASTSEVAELRRDINRIRGESMKHKREFERASKELNVVKEENRQLQALCKPDKSKVMVDANHVMDQLDCEICTGRMWTPYVLPDCGHAFCQNCLQNWFATAQTQFLASHPEHNPQQAHQLANLSHFLRVLSQNPLIAQDHNVHRMIEPLIPPQPSYTCPTCREPVRTRPTEVFALKAVVRTLAAAAGEKSPQKNTLVARKGKTPATTAGPWDRFFPPKRT